MSACPRCHAEVEQGFYGPCSDCRTRLRAGANEGADERRATTVQSPAEKTAKAKPPVVAVSKPVTAGVDCRLCHEPVDYPTDAHPCCVLWQAMGYDRCWACAESHRTGRITEPLRPLKRGQAA